ncbi:MAG: HAD family hydrolase [Thermoplasmata archaeon]|nr:HAD family hydrolase [Thermoplasmata archaeon]
MANGRTSLRGVTLDLWYTLIYETAPERSRRRRETREAWARPLRDAGVRPARARSLYAGMLREALAAQDRGHAWTIADQTAWMERRVGAKLDGAQIAARLVQSLDRAEIRLTPGLPDCLERLTETGVRLGLVSNITTEPGVAVHRLLDRLRLTKWFDAIVLSNEFGRSKPDPALFRHCLRRIRCPPALAMHVGDLPVDVEGARSAGMRSALYVGADRWSRRLDRRRRHEVPEEVRRIAQWSEWRAPWVVPPAPGVDGRLAGRRGR